MKLAIMQPYLFPYLGYFQLVHAVDTFVIYDDVNYIKGGWINRNYIYSKSGPQLLTLETIGASQNKLIKEVGVGKNQEKILKTLSHTYTKAPMFDAVYPMLAEVLMYQADNLADYIGNSLKCISSYLGIERNWLQSSALEKDEQVRGQDKILTICEVLHASQYINMPGGRSLYDRERFRERGINLSFIEPRNVRYSQFDDEFIPNLSIVDVMMFNDVESCSVLLREYDLV